MEQTHIYSLITQAVSKLRVHPTFRPRLLNKWLPGTTWVEAVNMSGFIDKCFIIDTKNFNKAMSSTRAEWGTLIERYDGSNTTSGVFRVKFKNTLYYYVTEKMVQVDYPMPLDVAWRDRVLAVAENALVIPTTRSRPAVEEGADSPPTRGWLLPASAKGQTLTSLLAR